MNTQKEYEVVNGPALDTLLDSFKYAYSKVDVINLHFSIPIGITFGRDGKSVDVLMPMRNVRITSIGYEDGSGERFLIKGFLEADPQGLSHQNPIYSHYSFDGYYDAHRRKGWLKLK
jgi:hypothetical protein